MQRVGRATAAAAVAAAAVCGVVLFPAGARAASAGDSHSCVVLEGGLIKCWGEAVKGQLGQEDGVARGANVTDLLGDTLPVVPLGTNFEAATVVSGNEFSCALSVDKAVKCWGMNQAGQLGQGDTERRGGANGGVFEMGDNLPPVDVVGVNGAAAGLEVESISLGGSSACAVITGGLLKCWGLGEGGQLGLGDTGSRGDQAFEMGDSLPTVDLGTGASVTSVAVGARHACAVIEEGRVKCWGNNNGGQLGLEDRNPRGSGIFAMGDELPFVDLGTGQQAIAVAAGFFHTCALLETGDVKCWGFGSSGQLGQGSNSSVGDAVGTMGDNLAPIDLGTGRTAVAVSLGGTHTCAVLDDDTVKCFGGNSFGSLGLGDLIPRGIAPGDMGDSLPAVPLTFGEGGGSVSNIFAGTFHTCAAGTEGGLACFGYNHQGQLGASTPEDLGDDPGEVEDLASIELGDGATVLTPVSPMFRFNNPLPTAAPSTSSRSISTGGDSDDGVPTSTIAAAASGGAVIFLIGVAVCCCCFVRRRKEERLQERRRAAVAGAGAIAVMEGGDGGFVKPKTADSGKRVQFSGDLNPETFDAHPLLKGVNLDKTPFVSLEGTNGSSGGLPDSRAVPAATAEATTATTRARAAGASGAASSASSKGSSSFEGKTEISSAPTPAPPGAETRGAAAPTGGPVGLAEGPAQVGDAGGYVLVEGRSIPPPSTGRSPTPAAVVAAAGATAAEDSGRPTVVSEQPAAADSSAATAAQGSGPGSAAAATDGAGT